MKEPAICMRSRLSQRDCYYGGGLVNGARNVTLMADCANRLMAREYGNIGRCRKVQKVHMFYPYYAGDYMEYHARILHTDGNRITLETRCFKIGLIPEDAPFERSAEILENPITVMAMIAEYEVPEERIPAL